MFCSCSVSFPSAEPDVVGVKSCRKCVETLERSGSLHVTRARLPARFATMSCPALRILFSSLSMAKSFVTISLVVMHAIVTLRSTTG